MTELNPDLVVDFWAFVNERQSIWHRRFVLQQPRPWTSDPVLSQGHFTNVYRWLDPGTQYAIRALQAAPSREDQIYFTVGYRLLNRQEVFERFGRPPYRVDHFEWLAFLEAERAAKRSIFTRRHLTPYWKQYQEATSLALALEVYGTSAEVYKQLRKLPGVGTFIGWQCYADLTYVPDFLRFHETFVRPGDGASYALSVMLGQRDFNDYAHQRLDSSTRVRPSEREQELLAEHVVWLFRTQPALTHPQPLPLSVIDLEHALCEWLRYCRARESAGQRHQEMV